MKLPFFGKKPPAVTDPVAHAQTRTGRHFRVVRTASVWEPYAARFCTHDFMKMDGGYTRHCGPTAMVNLIKTVEARYPAPPGTERTGREHFPQEGESAARKASETPAQMFRQIAAIGLEKHFYINADILGGLFGGTFNPVLRTYLRLALRRYHRTDLRISHARPAWRSFLTDALDRGSLLYLALVFHPLYGNHHVIGYGYQLLESDDGARKLYVRVADGWDASSPRYLCADDLRFSHFLEISVDR